MTLRDDQRLTRCLSCGAKVKIAAGRSHMSCPSCGLTLIRVPGVEGLPPVVIPRVTRDDAWRALLAERRLPEDGRQVTLREARLLLVPFWRSTDPSRTGPARRGRVVSGSQLLSAGLPSLTSSVQEIGGLEVEARTRVGDAMGRLDAAAVALDAVIVDVMEGPDGERPDAVLSRGENEAEGWRLLYHPLWSFRYVARGRQHFHMVDAAGGMPVGPARRMRWLPVTLTSALMLLAIYLGARLWVGPAAAIPAWLVSLLAMRVTQRRLRRP